MRTERLQIRLSSLPLLISVAALGYGCAATRPGNSVAEFASRSVSCVELQAFASKRLTERPAHTASELVEDYVVSQLLAGEARRTGLERDPEFIRKFRLARRNLLLESSEASRARGIEVNDEQVAAYYDDRAEELNRPERIKTRIILRRLPANASRAALNEELGRLRDVQAQFLSGASFADLAVQHSEHDSAAVGGAMQPWVRGEMGDAFERVVGGLEPGEISDVVRLPDGLALVLFEEVLPASDVPFESVALEMRGRMLQEQRTERANEALEQARALFPSSIDDEAIVSTDPGFATLPVARIGDDVLTLADLGLERRPPFLREAVQRAVDDELLVRVGERNAPAPTRNELARLHDRLVTEIVMQRLVRAQVPALEEAELRQRYAAERERFTQPERRVLEVVRVVAESGNLQEARAAAEAIARIWRPDGPIHQRNRAEVWGPIGSDTLAAATSVELARVAFSLDPGTISPPVLVEPHAGVNELAYALLRLHAIEPAGVQPFEVARDRLIDEIEGPQLAAARGQVRTSLLRQAQLKILPPIFDCPMSMPAETEAAPTQIDSLPSPVVADEEAEQSGQ